MKNLEIIVLEPNNTTKAVNFNLEFSSTAFYYLLKLRKIKIDSCSYIKILMVNEIRTIPISYTPANGILFIEGSFDFTHYLQLSKEEKLKFQYEMVYEILKNAFIQHKVDWKILDNINNELAENNFEMRYEWTRKKINKTQFFKLFIHMDIDALSFVAEITEENKKEELLIFKSIPGYFVIEFLFKAFKIVDHKVRIGSKDKAIFEIDTIKKTVEIIDMENKYLGMFKYGKSSLLSGNLEIDEWQ